MSDIRYDAFWAAVKARLSTSRMNRVLYGTRTGGGSRVYRNTDDYEEPEGNESAPWGRVVIIPATTLWHPQDVPGETRKTAFVVRAEFNNYRALNYEATADLEAAQEEVYNLLEEWLPTSLNGVFVAFNIYRQSAPQAMPFYDDLRGVWWSSAEYRFEAARLVAT